VFNHLLVILFGFVCQIIQVVNSEGTDISFQVDYTCNLLDTPSITPCFQLHFIAELGPLEIKKYTIINLPTDISTKYIRYKLFYVINVKL